MVNFCGSLNRRSAVRFCPRAHINTELNQNVADTSEMQDVVPNEADGDDDAERARNAVYNGVAFR